MVQRNLHGDKKITDKSKLMLITSRSNLQNDDLSLKLITLIYSFQVMKKIGSTF